MTGIPALEGAGDTLPDFMAEPANAAEFAALWNAYDDAERARAFERIRSWREDSLRCFREDHAGRVAHHEQLLAQRTAAAQRPDTFVLAALDFDDARPHGGPGCRTVVTPRSPNRGRDIHADELHVTEELLKLSPYVLATFLETVLPCIQDAPTRDQPRIRILTDTTIHQSPIGDAGITACCGRPPFELAGDQMTTIPHLITCEAAPRAYALAEGDN